ncbi:hypothetical protein BJ878DRAFT_337770 [Calycina marina]|uniref:Uncharacterized protein n=1 Tax=Calycina marina TaxID=1763456 RepID=A0A9P7Z5M5_9HELO|nr:hypothetical protein BJ878DRAFT_337770 [Calycina marina]
MSPYAAISREAGLYIEADLSRHCFLPQAAHKAPITGSTSLTPSLRILSLAGEENHTSVQCSNLHIRRRYCRSNCLHGMLPYFFPDCWVTRYSSSIHNENVIRHSNPPIPIHTSRPSRSNTAPKPLPISMGSTPGHGKYTQSLALVQKKIRWPKPLATIPASAVHHTFARGNALTSKLEKPDKAFLLAIALFAGTKSTRKIAQVLTGLRAGRKQNAARKQLNPFLRKKGNNGAVDQITGFTTTATCCRTCLDVFTITNYSQSIVLHITTPCEISVARSPEQKEDVSFASRIHLSLG